MANIIPFPKNFDNYKEVEALIAKVCLEAGLSKTMIDNVTKEYHEYYNQLFVKYESTLELPADLKLSQEQVNAILLAHSNTVQSLNQQYIKQISHACHIIIGLLVREQLNSRS